MSDKIQDFLDEGNDVNAFDIRFGVQQAPTPLIWAIIKMSPKDVELLLENGADPNIAVNAYFRGKSNKPKYSGGNALTWAAGYTGVGVTIAISRRIEWYGTMQEYRRNRMGPKRLKIVKLLLEYGASPHKVSILGYTALDLVRMHRPLPNDTPVGVEDNDAEIVELLEEYMKLWSEQKLSYMSALNLYTKLWSEQKLSYMSALNPRLGRDSLFNYLDHNTMQNLENYLSYNPDVIIKYGKEKRRDKLTKSRQRLASMRSMHSREGPLGKVRYDPSLMERVSGHLSRIGPVPSVQERLMLEDRQTGSGISSSRRNRFGKRSSFSRRRSKRRGR